MTIVVANRDGMVADSQLTEDGLIYTGYCKIAVMEDGTILGGAGSYSDILKFFQWFAEEDWENPIDVDKDFGAIILTPAGKLFKLECDLFPQPIHEGYVCMGSGQHYAEALMDAGLTPFEAVKQTCVRHQDCSPPLFGAYRKEKGPKPLKTTKRKTSTKQN